MSTTDPAQLAAMARFWIGYGLVVGSVYLAVGRRRRARVADWLERHLLGDPGADHEDD